MNINKNEGYFDARCSFKDDYIEEHANIYYAATYLNVFFFLSISMIIFRRVAFFQNDIWADIDDSLSFCFFLFSHA
jgi:hypothetical protein